MPPHPSPPWKKAASFDHLLELGRRFVTGELTFFPGWGGAGLDDESEPLADVLIAANDRGLLTVASQPGAPFAPGHDGLVWAGRAFVGGFAREETAADLAAAAARLGLLALREPASGAFSVPVGLRDGLPYLVLATGGRAEELDIFLSDAGPGSHQALRDLPFLWLVDPAWGRRDRLAAALRAHQP